MIKARKRWLSILLTLAMLATLLVPMVGPASAATTYSALTCPTVSTPATNVELGTINISIDTLAIGTHSAVFTLPTDAVITAVYTSASAGSGSGVPTVNCTTSGYAGNECRIDVVAANVYTDVKIQVKFRANLPNLSGDIKCDITNVGGGNSQLVDGSVVVARASTGEVTLSCPDVTTLTSSGGTVKVNIKENTAGALKAGTGSLKLTLPPGFTWTGTPTIVNLATGSPPSGIEAKPDTNDARKLNINVSTATSSAATLRVQGDVAVDESTAKFGDVEVSFSSDANTSYTPSSLKVATYADYGVSVKEKTSKDIIAGKKEQLIGEFTIEEAVKGSLVPNRTITLTLPAGVKWMFTGTTPTNVNYTCDKGSISLTGPTRVDDQTIKYTTPATTTSDATVIRFKDIKVNVAVDAVGDVNITVGGSAGASGTVKVATIKPAVTAAAASTPDVIIGEQGQVAGDVTITEGVKEAMKSSVNGVAGYVYVTTPSGVKFAAVPTVAVSDGDLQIDSTATKLEASDTQLTLKVKSSSTKPSTIKLTNVKLTLDRTVPVGPLALKVKGNAINETSDVFPASDTAAKVVVANCVTPSPTETKTTATFKIGEAKYTVNGVEQTMDAACYIENGRAFAPLRYVAYAAGVAPENILYSNGKVTVMKGDKVVQLTIGSNVMVINGINVPMDVKAVVKNGRTMLPVRWLSQALGCKVDYDGNTQTVTVSQ